MSGILSSISVLGWNLDVRCDHGLYVATQHYHVCAFAPLVRRKIRVTKADMSLQLMSSDHSRLKLMISFFLTYIASYWLSSFSALRHNLFIPEKEENNSESGAVESSYTIARLKHCCSN